MSYLLQAGVLLIEVLFGLAAALFILRVALPLVRANFYNPICQFVYRATHPVVTPTRRLVRPAGRFETAAALVAWLIVVIKVCLVQALAGQLPGFAAALVLGLADLLGLLIAMAFWLILIRAILSFVSPGGHHPALPLIAQLSEPMLAPLRRLLPDLGGIDLSPMLAILLLLLARLLIVAPIFDAGLALARG
jgi:YggT family protein